MLVIQRFTVFSLLANKSMKLSKYKVLIDYGAYEGMKFWDDKEYETVDEAVKEALAIGSAYPFLIIQVVDWEAK